MPLHTSFPTVYTQQLLYLAHLRFAHMNKELSNYCVLMFQQLTSQGHLFQRYRLLQMHAMNYWCSVHLTLPLHWYYSPSSLIVSLFLTGEANYPVFVTFFNGCRIFSSESESFGFFGGGGIPSVTLLPFSSALRLLSCSLSTCIFWVAI